MILQDITDLLELEVITGGEHLQREVVCGFMSDQLSDVMGYAPEGAIWVTLQINQNVVALISCGRSGRRAQAAYGGGRPRQGGGRRPVRKRHDFVRACGPVV